MESITFSHKIFMALVLFAFSVNFSSAEDSTPKPVHFNSLYDDLDNVTIVSTNDSTIRDKRFFDGYSNLNWCYDKAKYDSGTRLGLYWNTDECCKKHVDCRRAEFVALAERFDVSCLYSDTRPCRCDEEFRACLKNVWIQTIAEEVGRNYFTTSRKCITRENMDRSCVRYDFSASGRYLCVECSDAKLNSYKRSIVPY